MLDHSLPRSALATTAVCLTLVAVGGDAAGVQMSVKETLRFAAEMARDGNWREAKYRWEQVSEVEPDNPRVLNNLAVASEALGESDEANGYYERALAAAGDDERIRDNYRRFGRFLEAVRQEAEQTEDGISNLPATASGNDEKQQKKAKTARVSIGLPVPPRLDLEGLDSVLVASFLAEDTTFLDVNRELTRYLRGEFRKRTPLEVVEAVPAPAIPEQTIEDLLANDTFWQHLAREYGADLIVSGVVRYDREDVSGFRDVDVVDSRTGQKVRETRFVEQEEFAYALDVFFIDGASGTLLFRDRMRQSAIFQGSQNDPITAFYELTGAMAGDILGVVTSRTRTEARTIFKR
jgi:hypothetical protein